MPEDCTQPPSDYFFSGKEIFSAEEMKATSGTFILKKKTNNNACHGVVVC